MKKLIIDLILLPISLFIIGIWIFIFLIPYLCTARADETPAQWFSKIFRPIRNKCLFNIKWI